MNEEGKEREIILAELGLIVLEVGEKLTHYEDVVVFPWMSWAGCGVDG